MATAKETAAEYVCEVCGRTFDTPQALGPHRASHKPKARRAKPGPKPRQAQTGGKKATPEALLEQLFPKGIPVAQLADASDWLEDTRAFLLKTGQHT